MSRLQYDVVLVGTSFIELSGYPDLEIRHGDLVFCVSSELHELCHFRHRASVTYSPNGMQHLPVEIRHGLLDRKLRVSDAFRKCRGISFLRETADLYLPFRLLLLSLVSGFIKRADLFLFHMALGFKTSLVHHAFLRHHSCSRCVGTMEHMAVKRCQLD